MRRVAIGIGQDEARLSLIGARTRPKTRHLPLPFPSRKQHFQLEKLEGSRRMGVETTSSVFVRFARAPSLYPFPTAGKGDPSLEPFCIILTPMRVPFSPCRRRSRQGGGGSRLRTSPISAFRGLDDAGRKTPHPPFGHLLPQGAQEGRSSLVSRKTRGFHTTLKGHRH
jgi:hypothetical protein